MNLDLLVAEIGSTTTIVSAFNNIDSEPTLVGHGQAPTTVLDGDVTIGLNNAIKDLKNTLGQEELT
jgi:hypothetical protein